MFGNVIDYSIHEYLMLYALPSRLSDRPELISVKAHPPDATLSNINFDDLWLLVEY